MVEEQSQRLDAPIDYQYIPAPELCNQDRLPSNMLCRNNYEPCAVQKVRILHLNISWSNQVIRRGETPMADILSDIGSLLRPLAKELIKGGIHLIDTVSNVASEAGEQCKDLVAEAKADLAKRNGEPPAKEAEQRAEEVADESDDQKREMRKARVRVRRSR